MNEGIFENDDDNFNEVESEDIDVPQQELFTIKSNYNSSEVNKIMKSSTKLFSDISPLFTETLTSFKKNKFKYSLKDFYPYSCPKKILTNRDNITDNMSSSHRRKNINITEYQNYFLRTQSNFKNKNSLLSPENPPSLEDKIKLTSYYKAYGRKKVLYKSPEEKDIKNNLFEKYNIKKKRYSDNDFPQITDNHLHLKISTPYFKNSLKANKTIDINKQLVHRVDEMTNFFLLKKYFKKIEKNQKNSYFMKKMPKIHIKPKKPLGLKKSNEYDEKKDEKDKKKGKKKKNSKNKEIVPKKLNLIGAIKFSQFKTFAYNRIIESQFKDDEYESNLINFNKIKSSINEKNTIFNNEKNSDNYNQKIFENLLKTKSDKHYLALNISNLNLAFKPNSRIEFSMSKLGNILYIYGGFSSRIYNELWMFDLEKNIWTKMPIPVKDDPTPRKNHTSIIIKDILFIYGGEIPKERPYEDLITYNLTTNRFYFPKIPLKKKINQRIGHICVGTNQTFLIQGGMDSRTHAIENSAYIYNIFGNYWHKLECIGEPLPYRVYHCAEMVNFYSKTSIGPYNFYYPPEDYQKTSIKRIKHEGIYIFGGVNEKKIYMNDLHIIRIGHKPCVNFKPKISGPYPEPRIKAKMLFLDNYNFVIIHGGITIKQKFCDDIVVLNLENFNWIKPIISNEIGEGKKLLGRIEHQIFFHEEKIYIFGGLGEESMLSMNFETVEFEVTGFYDNLMNQDLNELINI